MCEHSRKDYLDGRCSHRQYYSQFVTDRTREAVSRCIGLQRILSSTDEHFNDIPLAEWGCIAFAYSRSAMESCGDYLTEAGRVCICKEAAQQVKEKFNAINNTMSEEISNGS